MNLKELKPRKALNKAFLKVKPNRTQIEGFKANLSQLLDRINDSETEEFHKNLVIDFLKQTYYDPNHFVNTKGRNDLVIHNGSKPSTTVGVIIEAKSPTNRYEMVSTDNLNRKAFHELVLYYLREQITLKNLEIKHLVITNINEWFIFDVKHFNRIFAQNKTFVQQFNDFEAGRLADTTTDFFYRQVAEPFIGKLETEMEFTYFDIRNYEKPLRNSNKSDDNQLIALFKILSPEHLLKFPFANDSNTLDKSFYDELLHIIGLTETKDGGKKIIERNKQGARNTGSLIENAIIQLDSLDKLSRLDKPNRFGSTTQERLFNVALELSITWVNRILFLKLLEAQLVTYHRTDKHNAGKGDKSFEFLNFDRIKDYDDLNSLFFQVLARKHDERNGTVKTLFAKVPYLNSSLFEPTEIEHTTIFISNLRNDNGLPIFSKTVLKDKTGKKRTGTLNPLEYLFEFLNAYDFTSEGSEEIQEDNKTLINASVLGLIFEKINGYKDGSFFTPGFITMYMCRETIRKAVIQKFNEAAAPLLKGAGGVSSLLEKGKGVVRRQIIPYNPKLKELARELRNNSTKSEIILWKELKGKFEGKYDFHRQKPLDNYIADFFCHELKLAIEIDGESHNWEETQQKDFQKEYRLNELGLNVLRFPDTDIFNHLENVLETIRIYIEGFEKRDLTAFRYEDTPLNPLSRGNFALPNVTEDSINKQPFATLDDIYDQIGEDRLFTRQQANNIVNSLKICDPAVGSGHFLVSALNEIIAIKNDLKILQDRHGRRLKEYQVEVVNDELIVTDEDGEFFEYNPKNQESQRIQETLFHEKQTIIEKCLFGVDINSNSVKICRLRLWIELLKNAYYKNETELETLPNIDINIKCGNSLVSRFAIDSDLKQALKKSKWTIDTYRIAVDTYRNAQSKEQKREMERLIADIKSDFRSEISQNDPKVKRLSKLSGELFMLTNQGSLFEMGEKEKADWNKKVQRLTDETKKLETEIEEIKANKIYENAFEWRFEFPEVLNNDGDFVGFDAVIGNPPYVQLQKMGEESAGLQKMGFETFERTGDIYSLFYELGYRILKEKGTLTYITSNKWMRAGYGESTRKFFAKKTNPVLLIDFAGLKIFDEATVDTNILMYEKRNNQHNTLACIVKGNVLYYLSDFVRQEATRCDFSTKDSWTILSPIEQSIKAKIEAVGTPLKDWDINIYRGILTGYNEAFIINGKKKDELIAEDPKSAEIIRPILRGRDIKRYGYEFADIYLIATFPSLKIDIEQYPAVKQHLLSFGYDRLKQTGEPGARKRTNNKWFETQDSISYWEDFSKQKITYIEIMTDNPEQGYEFPCFSFDTSNCVALNTAYIMTGDVAELKYILGVLNSKIGRLLVKNYVVQLQQRQFRMLSQYVVDFPIPKPNEYILEIINSFIDKILYRKKHGIMTMALELEINKLIYEIFDFNEEEIEFISYNS